MKPCNDKCPVSIAPSYAPQEQISLPLGISVPVANFRYPDVLTLPAIALAIMLKRYYVSTPSMTYSELWATRLPAYIGALKAIGLREFIDKSNLPTTNQERPRHSAKPFARYCLLPCVIEQEGERGQLWADEVIALHNVRLADFTLSKLWLAHSRGEA